MGRVLSEGSTQALAWSPDLWRHRRNRVERICPCCKRRPKVAGIAYCRECATLQSTRWRQENRERHRKSQREWCRRKKDEIISHYGGKCACCGETTREFLTIDHKHNNGNAERRAYKSQTWKLALRRGLPNDYQILCYNCNNARSHRGICPHENKN
jgi:hypothetical protein